MRAPDIEIVEESRNRRTPIRYLDRTVMAESELAYVADFRLCLAFGGKRYPREIGRLVELRETIARKAGGLGVAIDLLEVQLVLIHFLRVDLSPVLGHVKLRRSVCAVGPLEQLGSAREICRHFFERAFKMLLFLTENGVLSARLWIRIGTGPLVFVHGCSSGPQGSAAAFFASGVVRIGLDKWMGYHSREIPTGQEAFGKSPHSECSFLSTQIGGMCVPDNECVSK